MGMRRMRDLKGVRGVDIAVIDHSRDRLDRAAAAHGVKIFSTLPDALAWNPDAFVISTPPDCHSEYVRMAFDLKKHHFVEAAIRVDDAAEIEKGSQAGGIISATSCTFRFLPLVHELKKLIVERVGKVHSYQFFLSADLPGWHPEEKGEFYAYRPATSAVREMVPFELHWLNFVFGDPVEVSGLLVRRGNLPVDAADSFIANLVLQNGAIGQISVLMGSPAVIRRGICAGDLGILEFDLYGGLIQSRDAQGVSSVVASCGVLGDVVEGVYRKEIETFIEAIRGTRSWPHTYLEAELETGVLAALELSAQTGKLESVEVLSQPSFELTTIPQRG